MLLQAHYPSLESVNGYYVWLKENSFGDLHNLTSTTYIRETAEEAGDWMQAHIDEEWGPKPNPLCKWCPVITCEHNKFKSKR